MKKKKGSETDVSHKTLHEKAKMAEREREKKKKKKKIVKVTDYI